MQKHIFILSLLTLFIVLFISCGQAPSYFEGKIIYQYSYESETLNADSLAENRTASSEFYYQGARYKNSFIGKTIDRYIFNGDTGFSYHESSQTDTILCEDYRLPTDSVINLQIIPTKEKVLGYATQIIEIVGKFSTTKFWVSTTLKTNPDWYKSHQAYNWHFYLEQADGGIILKVEHIFKHFTMHGIATEVKLMDVPEKIFELQKDKILLDCKGD